MLHPANGPTKSGLGVELPSRCSIGGARRDRTVDLYNAIVALSQLSYGPEILAPGLRLGGARYKSCPAALQLKLPVALALVVLDLDLDLEILGIVGEILFL